MGVEHWLTFTLNTWCGPGLVTLYINFIIHEIITPKKKKLTHFHRKKRLYKWIKCDHIVSHKRQPIVVPTHALFFEGALCRHSTILTLDKDRYSVPRITKRKIGPKNCIPIHPFKVSHLKSKFLERVLKTCLKKNRKNYCC